MSYPQDLIERLQSLECSTIERFSFDGIETYARVSNVHDPDTITIIFENAGEMIKLNIRLEGIDAPELNSTLVSESKACIEGTKKLKELCADRVIRVVLGKYDKYGRVMSVIHTIEPIEGDLTCINDYLLKYQYVRTYSGGRKVKWTQSELKAVGTKKETSETSDASAIS